MINYPDPNCNADNPDGPQSPQDSSAALPHYYLWGIGEKATALKPGQLLNNRYLLKRDRIFLDTKPDLVPEAPADIPDAILPYLHLSVYPLHVPRLYAVLETQGTTTLMLESSAFSTVAAIGAQPGMPVLLPMLAQSWLNAPPLRQLSWLWQIAQMWEGFQDEKVAAALLSNDLVRVDGSIVRLLALTPKADQPTPTLVDLAHHWQPLATTAHASVQPFLTELCNYIEQGQINPDQLCEQLSLAISVCAQAQGVDYNLAVHTDQGPTRKRNEDACFPENGTSLTRVSEKTTASPQLLIVCDGIGGHQGGDVASKLAIATIKTQLAPLMFESATLSATEVMLAIERAICAANDEISAQNDQAKRQARDRMGTTLVLALIKGADVYIAHLGDSRAYRISAHNCQQVTLDDDVASRQVRLGGSLYREMLNQAGAGSLVQALGMGSSQMLRPTVQRFVIDEDCAFLLCSDGLSDSDRVEQFWVSTLRPLVTGETTEAQVNAAGQSLVSIANEYNGHDNVTVGLLAAQVTQVSDQVVPQPLASPISQAVTAPGRTVASPHSDQSRPINQTKTQQLPISKRPLNPQPSTGRSSLQKIGAIILLLALFGAIVYTLFPGLRQPILPNAAGEPTSERTEDNTAVPNTSPDAVTAAATFAVGDYMRIRLADGVGIRSVPAGAENREDNIDTDSAAPSQLLLYPRPISLAEGAAENVIPGTIPTGGIARVVNKQTSENQTNWIQLKLCSIPSGSSLAEVPSETDDPGAEGSLPINQPESTEIDQPLFLPPDSTGWTLESDLSGLAEPITDLQPTQIGNCG
ncbi:MAG: protein phosphatase 2C domain-containing protein [Cyanobacteria bacterium P01_D01_bin.1]